MTSCFIGAAVGSSSSAFVYARWGWTGISLLGIAFGSAATLIWLETRQSRRGVGGVEPVR